MADATTMIGGSVARTPTAGMRPDNIAREVSLVDVGLRLELTRFSTE